MKEKTVIRTLAALLLLPLFLSCDPHEEGPARTGSLSLSFATGPLTRAGNGNAADGGGIATVSGNPDAPDVVVFLFHQSNPSYHYRFEPTGTTDGECTFLSDTQTTIEFLEIPQGTYSVYAVANTEGLWPIVGSPAWSSITTEEALKDLVFTALSSGTVPAISHSRMPLSAVGTVTVTANHRGVVSLNLLRCLSKVSVSLVNQTDDALTLSDLDISLLNMCPDRGYLFAHSPDAPEGTTYGDITLATGDSGTMTNPGDSLVRASLVFPGQLTSPKCNLDFTVDTTPESFHDLPVQNYRAEDIPALVRNQHLHIQIRVSKGKMVSFNFMVGEWGDEPVESVSFD